MQGQVFYFCAAILAAPNAYYVPVPNPSIYHENPPSPIEIAHKIQQI